MITINPHLNFQGNCEEAFNFYKSVFGGDFSDLNRYKDMPPNNEHPLLEVDMNKIMHISLPISKETVLMGGDAPETMHKVITAGNNFVLAIMVDTLEEAERIFDHLAMGGKVFMPIAKAFWGDYFGMVTDKFCIEWMISCKIPE
jgi:PhnB protein